MTLGERNTLREVIKILKIVLTLTTPPGREHRGVVLWPDGGPLWRRCDCAIKALEKMLSVKSGTFR